MEGTTVWVQGPSFAWIHSNWAFCQFWTKTGSWQTNSSYRWFSSRPQPDLIRVNHRPNESQPISKWYLRRFQASHSTFWSIARHLQRWPREQIQGEYSGQFWQLEIVSAAIVRKRQARRAIERLASNGQTSCSACRSKMSWKWVYLATLSIASWLSFVCDILAFCLDFWTILAKNTSFCAHKWVWLDRAKWLAPSRFLASYSVVLRSGECGMSWSIWSAYVPYTTTLRPWCNSILQLCLLSPMRICLLAYHADSEAILRSDRHCWACHL